MIENLQTGPRTISIFGSTGSIGCNTLDVISHLGGREAFTVTAVSGRGNIDLLARQARECGAELAVTADETRYADLKQALSGSGVAAAAGTSALVEAAERPVDCVMAGIVGMAGLAPTLAAARRGADIALANKECLVSAGGLFQREIEAGGGRLLPVDSEHNAIQQVFDTHQRHSIERVILTASGGPFRRLSLSEMEQVTPARAAAHPNWDMGLKISIDSASMFNKALEMIEAMHLFSLHPEQIEVIHPSAVGDPLDGGLYGWFRAGPAWHAGHANGDRLRTQLSASPEFAGGAARLCAVGTARLSVTGRNAVSGAASGPSRHAGGRPYGGDPQCREGGRA